MKKLFSSAPFFFLLLFFLVHFLMPGLLSGCKSQPLPNEEAPLPLSLPSPPSLALAFRGIEADDPVNLRLFFALETEIPVQVEGRAKITSWRVEIEGQNAREAFNLHYPESGFLLRDPISLRLDMDIAALVAIGLAPKDEYNITLITEWEYSSASAQFPRLEARGSATFPGVRPPTFSITGIAILQAELVNTRFRVGIRIDNPNLFPIELSAFTYRLFGNGQFWAEGTERNILRVDGNSALSGNIFLLMNFIDMDRNLLDQIIRLEDVNYRFTGEVQVGTGIEYLPIFSDGFDLSGFSRVLER